MPLLKCWRTCQGSDFKIMRDKQCSSKSLCFASRAIVQLGDLSTNQNLSHELIRTNQTPQHTSLPSHSTAVAADHGGRETRTSQHLSHELQCPSDLLGHTPATSVLYPFEEESTFSVATRLESNESRTNTNGCGEQW